MLMNPLGNTTSTQLDLNVEDLKAIVETVVLALKKKSALSTNMTTQSKLFTSHQVQAAITLMDISKLLWFSPTRCVMNLK